MLAIMKKYLCLLFLGTQQKNVGFVDGIQINNGKNLESMAGLKQGYSPDWQVLLFITMKDKNGKTGQGMCGASILNRQYIITARHCLTGGPAPKHPLAKTPTKAIAFFGPGLKHAAYKDLVNLFQSSPAGSRQGKVTMQGKEIFFIDNMTDFDFNVEPTEIENSGDQFDEAIYEQRSDMALIKEPLLANILANISSEFQMILPLSRYTAPRPDMVGSTPYSVCYAAGHGHDGFPATASTGATRGAEFTKNVNFKLSAKEVDPKSFRNIDVLYQDDTNFKNQKYLQKYKNSTFDVKTPDGHIFINNSGDSGSALACFDGKKMV